MRPRSEIDAIMLSEKDSVATALRELAPGAEARVGVGEEVIAVPVAQPIACIRRM